MLEHDGQNLEQALGKTEADAEGTLRAAEGGRELKHLAA